MDGFGFLLTTESGRRYYFKTRAEADKLARQLRRPPQINPWDKKDGATAVYNRLTQEIIDIPADSTPAGYICGHPDGKDYDLLPNDMEVSA